MHHYRIVWEHEEKNREVEILVDYQVVDDAVHVLAIRPTKVSLYDAVTESLTREIKVLTDAGRRLLAAQFQSCRDSVLTLEEEIFAQLAERDGNLVRV